MITVDAVRTAVHTSISTIVSDLTDLVAIPSISASNHDQSKVRRSAEAMTAFLHDSGLGAEILSVPAPDDTPGRSAVLVHKAGPQGSPHALLYSHHDVQPVGDPTGWDQAGPSTAERCGERLFGRGAADGKAGVITHAHALRILAFLVDDELPCSVTVFVEGEEEVGSPSFGNLLTTHRDHLASDIIVMADSSNWKVGTPSLTTSLRGVVQVDARLDMFDHALRSDMYGGPVLDAVTAMCRLITPCHDDAGDVTVAGLVSRSQVDADFPDYPKADSRADTGILDGVELSGTGGFTARLWTRPSLTSIGMDVMPLESAGNVLTPSCTARFSLRIAPGQDPAAAQEALVARLEKHMPLGGRLAVAGRGAGPAFDSSEITPVSEAAHWTLSTVQDTEAVNIGRGGSIPFIATLKGTFPGAQVLITGIEDPDTRAHSESESIHLGGLERVVIAGALLLARPGGAIGS